MDDFFLTNLIMNICNNMQISWNHRLSEFFIYIREYLTNNKDVISFNYISQLDYVVSASCKEALNSILDELSSNLKNIFDTELLR